MLTVVLVEAVSVGPVVDSVVRGRVEEEAEGPEVAQQLGVDQELVEEVELGVHQHVGGGHGQRQGEVEPVRHPAQTLQHRLPAPQLITQSTAASPSYHLSSPAPEGGGEVEVLTAVMDLVHCPESSHLVAGPVEPVVAAVQQDGSQDPGGGSVPGQGGEAVLVMETGVTSHHQHPGHQSAQCHQQPAAHTRHTEQLYCHITVTSQ